MACLPMSLGDSLSLEICLSPSGRVRQSSVKWGNAQAVPNEYLGIVDVLSGYLRGMVDPAEILPLLELPRGLRGMVYVAMLSIPRGKVATYQQLARLVGTGPRVVGKVASVNRLPVIVPCHRVVMSNHRLGGYSLGGAKVKELLLRMEGVLVIGDRVHRAYVVSDEELRGNFNNLLSRLGDGVGMGTLE